MHKELSFHIWVLYSVPLVYVSVFVPVPCCLCDHSFVVQLEIRHCDAPALFFLFNSFGDSGPFLVPYKFKDYLLQFFEKCPPYFDRDSMESVDCSG